MSKEATAPNGHNPRTAGEAGWHPSRYNLRAKVPGTDKVAIANLYRNTYVEFSWLEAYLLNIIEELNENHPMVKSYARRGLVVNFDEREALEAAMCAARKPTGGMVWFTVCPTMACNFDCPYCFEANRRGKMSPEVQDDVVALAGRMLDASDAKELYITWYGGEPLLAPDVIESLSERLIALAEDRGVKYHAHIVTNGSLLTQDTIDLLERCRVTFAQITVDGIGATHDATRHLKGGGATFDRIIANLRDLKLPFRVNVRANIHKGNLSQVDDLKALTQSVSEESGNTILFYAKAVLPSVTADERGKQVDLLSGADAATIDLRMDISRTPVGDDHMCAAISLWSVLIDAQGNLHKCAGLTAADPEFAYGNARDWDPADPLATASAPDNLTKYLAWASPMQDEECRECMWLPLCGGGCPHYRLLGRRMCLPFRDDPERYVLTLHDRLDKSRQRS